MVFLAFTHGIAFPILWPIALIGLINNYVVERICLAYYYRKPPMMDNKLNLSCLHILQYAPLFTFSFGYWTLGNSQMFFNLISPKTRAFGELIDP